MNVYDVHDWLWLVVAVAAVAAMVMALRMRRSFGPYAEQIGEIVKVTEGFTARIEEACLAERLSNEVKLKSDEQLRTEIRLLKAENQRVREANRSVLAELMKLRNELRTRFPTPPTNHTERSA
jgi:cell shape-determining protein MreC